MRRWHRARESRSASGGGCGAEAREAPRWRTDFVHRPVDRPWPYRARSRPAAAPAGAARRRRMRTAPAIPRVARPFRQLQSCGDANAIQLLPSPEDHPAFLVVRREVFLQVGIDHRCARAVADGVDGGCVGIAGNEGEADARVLFDTVDDITLPL